MSASTPSPVALTNIADGAAIVASDHRNNYSAVQTAVNALIAVLNLVTAKGDLLAASGLGAYDHLPVGSNGQVLTADSAQTLGVKWAANSGALLTSGRGADLAAAATITVTNQVHRVSGATPINNISGFVDGAVVTLIATSGSVSITSSGNIWATSAGGTRVIPQHAAVSLVYSSSDVTWQVSGVGS